MEVIGSNPISPTKFNTDHLVGIKLADGAIQRRYIAHQNKNPVSAGFLFCSKRREPYDFVVGGSKRDLLQDLAKYQNT